MTNSKFSFEESYSKLEKILEMLNQGELSLDQSLKLYEEADKLILKCQEQLSSAEQKIQALIKNRSGDVALDKQERPMQEPYTAQQEQYLNRNF